MSIELKPCPFCGKTESVKVFQDIGEDADDEYNPSGYYAVNCDFTLGGCGATGGYKELESAAVGVWNTRVHNALS